MPAKGTKKLSKNKKAEAVAIAETVGSQSKAAKITGISQPTISVAAKDPEVQQNVIEKKKELADKFEEYADKALDALLPKLDLLTPRDFTSIGIAVDKMLLLRGQPTSITATVSPEARQSLRTTFQNALAELKGDTAATLAKLTELPGTELAAPILAEIAQEFEGERLRSMEAQ